MEFAPRRGSVVRQSYDQRPAPPNWNYLLPRGGRPRPSRTLERLGKPGLQELTQFRCRLELRDRVQFFEGRREGVRETPDGSWFENTNRGPSSQGASVSPTCPRRRLHRKEAHRCAQLARSDGGTAVAFAGFHSGGRGRDHLRHSSTLDRARASLALGEGIPHEDSCASSA